MIKKLQYITKTQSYISVNKTDYKSLYSNRTTLVTCLILPRMGSRKAFTREVKKKKASKT